MIAVEPARSQLEGLTEEDTEEISAVDHQTVDPLEDHSFRNHHLVPPSRLHPHSETQHHHAMVDHDHLDELDHVHQLQPVHVAESVHLSLVDSPLSFL